MSQYMKKKLTPEVIDGLRINLSAQDKKLSPDPVCDFCGNDTPVVVYAAIRMSTGEYKHAWRWCACAMCEMLLDDNDSAGVIRRIVDRMVFLTGGRFSRELVIQAANAAFKTFTRYAVTLEEGGEGCQTKST